MRLRTSSAAIALLAAGAWAQAAEPALTAGAHAGSDACLTCHEDAGRSLVHFGASPGVAECEASHGPGPAHVDAGGDASKILNPATLAPLAASKTCLSCHSKEHRLQGWSAGQHDSANVSCLSCHRTHNASGKNDHLLAKPREMDVCFACHKMQRVQTMASSHMPLRENKMSCSDCHNPHGTTTVSMLNAPSSNDSCYECHGEKRGPVLFEHPPVRENCLNCHNPHGSLHPNLLVANPPRLCQSCHIGTRHPSQPQTPTSRFVFNKSCINCHPSIHGSNHPGGVRLMR